MQYCSTPLLRIEDGSDGLFSTHEHPDSRNAVLELLTLGRASESGMGSAAKEEATHAWTMLDHRNMLPSAAMYALTDYDGHVLFSVPHSSAVAVRA